MKNNNGTLIEYTAFNKPAKLTTPNATINFSYDTNHNRYKKSTDKYTTYYVDKSYEHKVNKDNTEEDKYFIYVGSKVMSIYTDNVNIPSTKYLHYDSLNSVDTITNNLGVVENRIAYKPFGEKLNLDKDGKVTQTPPKTNRGYTGHEHIEETKFINMNARLYDPTIARFISADSMIPYMYDTQSYNRYSYVRNNPLKYTDPSGHWGGFFKKVGRAISHAAKQVGHVIDKYKYKIGGAVSMVVGAVGLFFSEFGGLYWGPALMGAGASMIKYNPNEEDSPTNQIYIGTGGNSGVPDFTVVTFGGDSSRENEQQGQYLVNNIGQGTHSTTTGNKLNNGTDTSSFTVTVGNYNNVNFSRVGDNVLGVDNNIIQSDVNQQKGFFDGVVSVGIGLMRFGDYLARISGFRDWQNGSVVLRNYYQNQAISSTKNFYRIAKYIATNSKASSIFLSSSYRYITSNPEYFAGRVLAGPVLGFVAKNPIWGTGSSVGDLSYTVQGIDNFSRNLILGY